MRSQKGQNPDMQWNEITEWAAKNEVVLVGRYWDVASGSSIDSRLDYQRLMNDIKLDSDGLIVDKADGIICWDVDRLNRNLHDFTGLLEMLIKYHQRLFDIYGEADLQSADGRFILNIKGAVAQREQERDKERIRLGIKEYKRQYGKWGRGKALVDDNRMVELRKQGISLRGIATELNISYGTVKNRLRGLGYD
jgi:DNA invertase Pin-like site-specific DNA recombinase